MMVISERKRPLEKPTLRWEGNIRIFLSRSRMGGVNWIDLGQHRDKWRALATTVMDLLVQCNAGNFLIT
jgi:hypothetical protein